MALEDLARNATYTLYSSLYLDRDLWPYALSTIAASGLLFLLLSHSRQEVNVPIPLAAHVTSKKKRHEAYCFDSRNTLQQGYDQFKDEPFGVDSTEGVKLIVPMKFLDKLKSHSALSFQKSIDNDLLKEFSGVGGLDDKGVKILHTKFNPTLPVFTPQLYRIIHQDLVEILGRAKDWTPTNLHRGLTKIICKASAYVMHDEVTSQNPEWLEIIDEYVLHAGEYARALRTWPPFMRPAVSRFVPQRKEVARLWAASRVIVKQTLEAKKDGSRVPSDPPTILDYLTSGPNSESIDDVDGQVEQQLTLAVASIHTTSSSVVHCLYDLATHTEYVDELRQEVKEALQVSGGEFNKACLARLEKMDSFMKESQRLNSPDLTTFQRMAVMPFTLPDGKQVPKNTKLELATCSINVDESYFDNPRDFDGLRFYRRRQEGESNLLYTSVGKTNLGWGVGRHACPGRFLVDVEIKLIMAEILLHYNIKNVEGKGRPKNIEFEAIVIPDTEGQVLLKSLDI